MDASIRQAADSLLAGGVIAYPTEGVFGLGCLPADIKALRRLNRIKRRDEHKGFILLAANPEQLEGWLAPEDLARLPPPEPAKPVTWIGRPGHRVIPLLTGSNPGIAVRLSSNPIATAICLAAGSAITSTSANRSGEAVARDQVILRRNFEACVDYIVPGECGPARGASEIRILESGDVIRPGTP